MDKVEEVLKTLDEATIRLKEDKCKIAQSETEWLGYKLTASGVTPIAGKMQAIRQNRTKRETADEQSSRDKKTGT